MLEKLTIIFLYFKSYNKNDKIDRRGWKQIEFLIPGSFVLIFQFFISVQASPKETGPKFEWTKEESALVPKSELSDIVSLLLQTSGLS